MSSTNLFDPVFNSWYDFNSSMRGVNPLVTFIFSILTLVMIIINIAMLPFLGLLVSFDSVKRGLESLSGSGDKNSSQGPEILGRGTGEHRRMYNHEMNRSARNDTDAWRELADENERLLAGGNEVPTQADNWRIQGVKNRKLLAG